MRKPKVYDVLWWNLWFRPIATAALAAIATGLLWVALCVLNWLVFWAFELELELTSFDLVIWLAIFVLLCALAQIEDETEVVPETKFVALVTWLGMPTRFLRETGEYSWVGKRLWFGRTTVVFAENKGGFTDSNGFIKYGPIPFKVWDRGDSKIEDRTVITAPGKNRANIKATLTLILKIEDPRKLLNSDDPALDIGDRARQEYREMTRWFVDTDLASLQQSIGEVLTGHTLITCFLPKAVGGHKLGAMITDNGGNAMFRVVGPKQDPATVRKEFIDDVLNRGDDELIKIVATRTNGQITGVKTDTVKLEKPIQEVIENLGMRLERVTFGDIIFSVEVQNAANQASAETDERVSQLASAQTQKEVRLKMLPTKDELDNPAWETAMLLAAAQDDKTNSVKIIHVTGGDKLTKAAVVAGQQIGGSKE